MTTIRDVANRSGVSTATVSHVINGTRFVSEEVRLKVIAVMEELNYQPNAIARGLRTRKTRILALIIPDITNPFFADFTRGFQDTADEKDNLVILCNTDRIKTREIRFLEMMWQQRVDGIVINPAKVQAEDLRQLTKARISVVLIGSQINDPDFDTVMVDNIQAGYDAVQHLIDLGHRRIGLVCGSQTTSSGQKRYQGYCRAMNENKLPIENALIVEKEITYEGGREGMQQLLSLPDRPSAVFSTSDIMALGAKTAIEDAGLNIPANISLVGFDGIPEVSRTYPKLTTIEQPAYQMGQTAAQVLLEQIEANNVLPRRKIVLPHQLVVRESTANPT